MRIQGNILQSLKRGSSKLQSILVVSACLTLPLPAFAQGLLGVGNDTSGSDDIFSFGYSYSHVDLNSQFQIGTVVVGPSEASLASIDDDFHRNGFDIIKEFDIPVPGLLFGPNAGITLYFGLSRAEGSLSSSGFAEVGVGGVTELGVTFLTPDGGLGTGVSTPFAGDSLNAHVNVRNDWTLGRVGFRETVQSQDAAGVNFYYGANVMFENFGQDIEARADILRGGVSLVNQRLDGSISDNYYGVEFNAGVSFTPADNLQVALEAYGSPAYHETRASLTQTTAFGGGVTQSFRYEENELAFSAGFRTNVKFGITDYISLQAGYEYSYLDGVGELHVPAGPADQPVRFDTGTAERHFFRGGVTVDAGILYASDLRLKRNIRLLGQLSNGLKLYRYRYNWSDQVYVGVMAQEVAARYPDAVVKGQDGYLRVNYKALGLKMETWTQWLKNKGAATNTDEH